MPDWPRLMRHSTAAMYCDLTPAKFLGEVQAGRLPFPFPLAGEDHWDRKMLDAALDRITGVAFDWRQAQPGLAR